MNWHDKDWSGKYDRWETAALVKELFGPQDAVVLGLVATTTFGEYNAIKNLLELAQSFQ